MHFKQSAWGSTTFASLFSWCDFFFFFFLITMLKGNKMFMNKVRDELERISTDAWLHVLDLMLMNSINLWGQWCLWSGLHSHHVLLCFFSLLKTVKHPEAVHLRCFDQFQSWHSTWWDVCLSDVCLTSSDEYLKVLQLMDGGYYSILRFGRSTLMHRKCVWHNWRCFQEHQLSII